MDQQQIEAFLLKAIKDSGLTQGKLSRYAGVPQPCLSKFLSGKTCLDLVSIEKLLTYFGKELAIQPKPSTPNLPPAPVPPPALRTPEAKKDEEPDPAPLQFREPSIFNVPERIWRKLPKC